MYAARLSEGKRLAPLSPQGIDSVVKIERNVRASRGGPCRGRRPPPGVRRGGRRRMRGSSDLQLAPAVPAFFRQGQLQHAVLVFSGRGRVVDGVIQRKAAVLTAHVALATHHLAL